MIMRHLSSISATDPARSLKTMIVELCPVNDKFGKAPELSEKVGLKGDFPEPYHHRSIEFWSYLPSKVV